MEKIEMLKKYLEGQIKIERKLVEERRDKKQWDIMRDDQARLYTYEEVLQYIEIMEAMR